MRFLPGLRVVNRNLHRWCAVLTALPVLLILITGLLLQFKKEVSWIQPPTMKGMGTRPVLTFDRILEVARTVSEAGIREWKDIARLDVRPGSGIVKVRARNQWEIQIDTRTGKILQAAFRRSDFLESLHDGTFFHEGVKLYVFFPVAVILLCLWVTGLYLWFLPHLARREKRRSRREM